MHGTNPTVSLTACAHATMQVVAAVFFLLLAVGCFVLLVPPSPSPAARWALLSVYLVLLLTALALALVTT